MSLSAATSRLHSASKNVRRISGKTEETGSLSGRSVWTRTMYTLGNADERKGNRRKWHRPPGSKRNTRVRTPRRKNRWNNATRMPEPLRDLFLFDIFSFPFLSFPFPFFSVFFLFCLAAAAPGTSSTAKNRGGVCARPTRLCVQRKGCTSLATPASRPFFRLLVRGILPFSRASPVCRTGKEERERENKKRTRERERRRVIKGRQR